MIEFIAVVLVQLPILKYVVLIKKIIDLFNELTLLQAVADVVAYHLSMFGVQQGERPSVHTAASLFNQLCYSNKDRLSAGIIVAGYDKESGGSVYNIPLGGGMFRQPWAIGGSGSTYVYGYCDATYKDNMTKDQTVEFVKNTLALAMSRDGSSGGVIRMCVITDEGVQRLFVPGNGKVYFKIYIYKYF